MTAPSSSVVIAQRQQLRHLIRARREALSYLQELAGARRLAHRLRQHPRIRQAARIGLYAGFRGELDPWRFHAEWSRGKQLLLPVLSPDGQASLKFVSAAPPWRNNRFGILEPCYREQTTCPIWQLDVLLLPLVAFDRAGNRLGMGGGFYDRTLAHLPVWAKRPWCMGVGYRFQEVAALPAAAWDQPLDEIITD